MRFNGSGRVVECIGILCRLAGQHAVALQRASAAVTEEAIVTYELDVVTAVTRLDAVYTDGVALRRVARAASNVTKIPHHTSSSSYELMNA